MGQARVGAPSSRCLSLFWGGGVPISSPLQERFREPGSWWKESRVCKEGGCFQQSRSCLLLPPAPLCGFRSLVRWLAAVVLLTFTKMAFCHLASCRGSFSKATSSLGTAPPALWGVDWKSGVFSLHHTPRWASAKCTENPGGRGRDFLC